ncbi:MAG: ferritin-like domain-containing protein [Ilumatobacteraceae bacterium]
MSSQLSRRDLFRLGGIGIISTTLLAACSKNNGTSDNAIASIGTIPPNTSLPTAEVTDVVLLRTAASLEYAAIDLYSTLLDAGYLSGDFAAVAAIARRFRDDHAAHAASSNSLVLKLGGQAFECANSRFTSLAITPAIALISTPENPDVALDAVTLAHAIETVCAQMQQGFVGLYSDPVLRGAAINVGQNNARHAVILAQMLNPGLSGVEPSTEPATGVSKVFAVPSAFGGLAIVRVPLGPPNAEGVKTSITMETPSLNALTYEFVSC